jgi:hypothetical protein
LRFDRIHFIGMASHEFQNPGTPDLIRARRDFAKDILVRAMAAAATGLEGFFGAYCVGGQGRRHDHDG